MGLIKHVKYGPVSLEGEMADVNMNVFSTSVNVQINHLEIYEKAKIVDVSSSVHPFLNNRGMLEGIYLAQILYESNNRT